MINQQLYLATYDRMNSVNSLLDLNPNMNLDPKMTVHDNMYDAKYQQCDALHELVFEPISHIRVSHVMIKVTSFIHFIPYLK